MPEPQENEAGSSFKIPIPSPRSSAGGQTPPDRSASSTHSTQKSSPREEVPDKAVAESKSKDGPQEEDDPLKVSDRADAEPKPRENRPNKYPKELCPFDDFDLNDDGQEESRVEGSVDSDSGVGDRNSGMQRSDSEGTLYDKPWDREESEKSVRDRLSIGADASSTGLPSVFTDNSQEPLLQGRNDSYVDGNDIKKTKRSPLRAKYAVQQANFVILVVSAAVIAIYTIAYATSVYLQDKGSLIAFIINNPKFITVPGIIALSLFTIGIFCAVKQFRNTIEHQIDEKDPDKILKKVLEVETKGQIIRHLTVEHSDGTILHYRFNTWEANKNGIANVDKEVIRKVGKIESVINDRPLFTALFTGFIVANVALPLWLYAAGGISNITTFYQSILATNVGLLSLVATGMFVLLIVYLGIRNYKQTSCTNVVYLKGSETSNKEVNEKLLDEAAEQRISATKECHDQTGKVESLRVTKVDFELFNGPTHSIACRE